MSSFIQWVAARAPHYARLSFSSVLSRPSLLASALIVSSISAAAEKAQAIEISIVSATLLPDSTASGVYTGSGQGTSAWDNELTTLNPGGTAPTKVGASATAEIRDAFSMSTVAPSDSAAAFTAISHLSVTIEVQNDDPLNDPVYELSVGRGISIISVVGGARSTHSDYNIVGTPLHVGNGTALLSLSAGGGPNSFGIMGTPGASPGVIGAYPSTSGTSFYTLDLELTNTTSSNAGGNISVLAGSDAGLNPLLGSSQHYPVMPPPAFATHTDPSLDGLFLSFTATVTSVPEPDSRMSLLWGTAILGSALGTARWRRTRQRA